jgi:hypothetical protein
MKFLRGILIVCLIAASMPATKAGQVTVKEVSLSLYNRPVNGYRVMLNRTQKMIAAQIVKHVTASGVAAPFEFERTIIFENVFYKPVTDSREISLYYLLRTVDAQYTEVTLVGMYDYKRCINFRDFPVLAIRMMADFSELVRKTSGDEILFDNMAYNPQTMAEIEKKYATSAMNQFGEPLPVKHTSEEEADREAVNTQGDPFAVSKGTNQDPDSIMKVMSLRRRELELKERELSRREQELEVQKQELEVTRNTLTRQLNSNGALKDSINSLNLRIASLQKQMLTGDEVSVSNDSRELVNRLQEELRISAQNYARLKAHSDSADLQLAALNEKEASARGRREVTQKKIAELETQNALYKEELRFLRASNGTNANESDSSSLRLNRLLSENEKLNQRFDSILTVNRKLENKLSRQTVPANNASALEDSLTQYRSRVEFLQGQERDNSRLKVELANKENLLRQNMNAIQLMEQEKKGLSDDVSTLAARNIELESLLETSAGILQDLRMETVKIAGELVEAQTKANSLQQQVTTLQGKVNSASSGTRALTDSLGVLRTKISVQKKQLSEKENEMAAEQRQNDSLSSALIRGSIRETLLTMRNDSLETVVDSLNQRAAPVTDQQRFIREQWDKLEKWDRELKGKETTLSEREKLAGQRESYLLKKEAELNRKEDQLMGIGKEKNKGTPEIKVETNETVTPGTGEFKIEMTEEFQQEVTLFCLYTSDPVILAQKKVATWFLSRDFFYKKFAPDFLFENVLLPELSVEPLQVRLRLETGTNGAIYRISFRKPDYKFIEGGLSPASDLKVENLLRSIAH